MFVLKRFAAFVAAGLLLIASRYYPVALVRGNYGEITYYTACDLPSERGDAYSYCRADTYGGEEKALEIIRSLGADVLFTEKPEGVTIYYCYSAAFPRRVKVNGIAVNLAVAVRGDKVSAGTPLLKGSY